MSRKLLEATGGRIGVTMDGKLVDVRAGDSVAAAMLAAGFIVAAPLPHRAGSARRTA